MQTMCVWSNSPPAVRHVAEKIEVVSVCLRSSARSRKRRCGICGCVRKDATLFCCVKTLALRYVALVNAKPAVMRHFQHFVTQRNSFYATKSIAYFLRNRRRRNGACGFLWRSASK